MRRRWRSKRWGGSRGLTNRIIDINADIAHPNWGYVRKRAWRLKNVASRKRWATYGNPGSDHHMSQKIADAVDFRYTSAHVRYFRMRETMRRLGVHGPIEDYGAYYVNHNGMRFRVQPIAAVHGTGPHLHFGVRRV